MEQRKEMDPAKKALLGGVIGYVAGEVANDLYRKCSPQEKYRWKENRIMHHGELGCITLAAGAASTSPFWVGVGAGLMVSDAQDAEEWFKGKKEAQATGKKRRSTG